MTSNTLELKLLSQKSIQKFQQKYNYLHLGLVQIAAKPLSTEGLNTTLLLCLHDCRFLDFQDSLLGMVETSLCDDIVHFNCFPNFIVSLKDKNLLDVLTLNVQSSNFKLKTGSSPIAIIYCIQYNAMNSAFNSRAFHISPTKGETILFQTDLQKSNLSVPKRISWNQVNLPLTWKLEDITPFDPPENTDVSHIQQFSNRNVEISFQRSRSFRTPPLQSMIPPSVTSTRPSVSSVTTHLQDINIESRIPQVRYTVQTEQESDGPTSPTHFAMIGELNVLEIALFEIDKTKLKEVFYSSENLYKRTWFLKHFQGQTRTAIQDEFYEFLNSI